MSLITLTEAQSMIAHYQSIRPSMLRDGYPAAVLPLCITFTKVEIEKLLAQQNCEYLRVYYGASDKDNLVTNILVAADENDNDIVPSEDYILINKGVRCPVNCPPPSVLTPNP